MRRGYAGRPDGNNIGLQGAISVCTERFVSRPQRPETLARFPEQKRRRRASRLKHLKQK